MNTKQFGEQVAALRKARGLTQAQLAEKLNISNKAVSRWETGEGYPEIPCKGAGGVRGLSFK